MPRTPKRKPRAQDRPGRPADPSVERKQIHIDLAPEQKAKLMARARLVNQSVRGYVLLLVLRDIGEIPPQ